MTRCAAGGAPCRSASRSGSAQASPLPARGPRRPQRLQDAAHSCPPCAEVLLMMHPTALSSLMCVLNHGGLLMGDSPVAVRRKRTSSHAADRGYAPTA